MQRDDLAFEVEAWGVAPLLTCSPPLQLLEASEANGGARTIFDPETNNLIADSSQSADFNAPAPKHWLLKGQGVIILISGILTSVFLAVS